MIGETTTPDLRPAREFGFHHTCSEVALWSVWNTSRRQAVWREGDRTEGHRVAPVRGDGCDGVSGYGNSSVFRG